MLGRRGGGITIDIPSWGVYSPEGENHKPRLTKRGKRTTFPSQVQKRRGISYLRRSPEEGGKGAVFISGRGEMPPLVKGPPEEVAD